MMLIWLLLATLCAQAPTQAAQPAEGAIIRGRVTDADSGAPVPRVRIMLRRDDPSNTSQTAVTNEEGVYEFRELPPASYVGTVNPGTSRAIYPWNVPLRPSSGPQTIAVKRGEVREVNVVLQRTYGIAVRVLDEFGEPLSGLEATARRALPGRRAMVTFRHQTDDLGRMRIFGLEAGEYVVCVEPRGPQAPRAVRTGPKRDELVPTCFPSAGEEDAELVRVGAGDAPEIEIRMRRGRTFTVSGRILDASGVPAATSYASLSKFATGSSIGYGVVIDGTGRFVVSSVLPGDYALEARLGGPTRPEQRRPLEIAFVPITVNSDIDDVVVQLQPGIDVSGVVTLENPTIPLPSPPGSGLMVVSRLADDRTPGQGSWMRAAVRKDLTFTFEGIFGKRRLDVSNVPRGWFVKSIQYDTKDVTDSPVEFKAARIPPVLRITLSNRGAMILGRVVDDAGQPVARAQVLMLAPDGTRNQYSASSSSNGTFRAGPLREGTYFVVALPSDTPPIQLGEWDRLSRLQKLAERVTLGELEERTVELRLVREK